MEGEKIPGQRSAAYHQTRACEEKMEARVFAGIFLIPFMIDVRSCGAHGTAAAIPESGSGRLSGVRVQKSDDIAIIYQR
jgi:hypothetical protein